MDAARVFTAGAIDAGKKPAVASAIAKYHLTELNRKLVNDAMDIMGGAGICRGERNRIANMYIGTPVGITVEGANILTRSLIIFGQGAMRCHPYAYRELNALQAGDAVEFDRALSGHLGHFWRNFIRSFFLSLSRGHLAAAQGGVLAPYYQKLAWASASFAFFADVAMFSLSGRLKFKEKLTGRFGDILSWMYLATATLRRFEAEHFPPDRIEVVRWALQYALVQIQQGFDGILTNMEMPLLGWLWRAPVALWSRFNPLGVAPDDAMGHRIAQGIQQPSAMRDALTKGVIFSARPGDIGARMEEAFTLGYEARGLVARVKNAAEAGVVISARSERMLEDAREAGLLTATEIAIITDAAKLQDDVIQVDAFARDTFASGLLPEKADQEREQKVAVLVKKQLG